MRSAGATRRRRGASAAILDVCARDGAAWRGRDASGELGTGREPGLGAWPTAPARRHGQNREGGDRVRANCN